VENDEIFVKDREMKCR